MPPNVPKINFEVLNEWKNYTLTYFKLSPNIYFCQNDFFNKLSEKLKTKLILDNMSSKTNTECSETLIMPNFIKNFDYLFMDDTYHFIGDKQLKVMILSSLTLEFVRSKEKIIQNSISQKIYFIDQGKVNVYYKD